MKAGDCHGGQLSGVFLERGGRSKEARKGILRNGLVPKKIELEAEALMVPIELRANQKGSPGASVRNKSGSGPGGVAKMGWGS